MPAFALRSSVVRHVVLVDKYLFYFLVLSVTSAAVMCFRISEMYFSYERVWMDEVLYLFFLVAHPIKRDKFYYR